MNGWSRSFLRLSYFKVKKSNYPYENGIVSVIIDNV